ncbi:hypothetical protein D9V29_13415 [Mycetocola manganoxydans]|uniref:Uncharacterized protein n=1 Tax=Mycetocola manganoxydans TaxID=699879 RepID=A0A3L6ZKU2_9MICO|nr:hypothetical protein [Mycetocola manganoxydans]RLP68478.1 hypothetical protein D9V29_13415 [Mycetocola manganoxydans]GHD52176.1 hypothetical protein GCM10008097_27830 [Mycetocola manganoxydans]
MRLGSSEHYGWERPLSVVIVEVRDGQDLDGEFARLRVPEGAKGGPLDVMVRLRAGRIVAWRKPAPGERIQVQSWHLTASQADLMDLELELGEASPWTPPKPQPDQWLWVEG